MAAGGLAPILHSFPLPSDPIIALRTSPGPCMLAPHAWDLVPAVPLLLLMRRLPAGIAARIVGLMAVLITVGMERLLWWESLPLRWKRPSIPLTWAPVLGRLFVAAIVAAIVIIIKLARVPVSKLMSGWVCSMSVPSSGIVISSRRPARLAQHVAAPGGWILPYVRRLMPTGRAGLAGMFWRWRRLP